MDSGLQAALPSKDSPSAADEWAALCRARIAAKKAHDRLSVANHGKFSTRQNGSIRARRSSEEITHAEAVRDTLDDIEKRMFAFLSRRI